MPKGNRLRYTVTIEDTEKVYRNSYVNNIFSYIYTIIFAYPNKKIWVFDSKKNVFYKIIRKYTSESGYPTFEFQIIK